MRLVKQFDEEGCGLACVAMAAGTTYRKVRDAVFPDGVVAPTQLSRLREIMAEHGVLLGERLVPFRTRTPEDLTFDALLKINLRKSGTEWHWVLWDYERQMLLDPRRPPYQRPRFVSYVRLYQPDVER